MGMEITATADSDTKPNYSVATTAAAVVAVADGEFVAFIGDSVGSKVEAYNGLEQCRMALREAGWPNPVTLQLSYAQYNTVTHTMTVGNGAAPTLAETDVAVLQGLDFTVAGDSNSPHVRRMAELYLESSKAA